MKSWEQILLLIRKDVDLEIRKKHVAIGLLLYIFSTIFLVQYLEDELVPRMWNLVFWILMIFLTITINNKSFLGEGQKRNLYYYTQFSPRAMIVSKQLYSIMISVLFGIAAYVLFSFFNPLEIADKSKYFVILILGTVSISLCTTFLSALSSQVSDAPGALTAVLGLPLLIPLFILIQRFSLGFVSSVVSYDFMTSVLLLLVYDVIIFVLSLLLFPLVWTE